MSFTLLRILSANTVSKHVYKCQALCNLDRFSLVCRKYILHSLMIKICLYKAYVHKCCYIRSSPWQDCICVIMSCSQVHYIVNITSFSQSLQSCFECNVNNFHSKSTTIVTSSTMLVFIYLRTFLILYLYY